MAGHALARRRGAIALVLSLLGHGLLALLFWRAAGRMPRAPVDSTVEIAIETHPPAAAPAPAELPPEPAPRPVRRRTRRQEPLAPAAPAAGEPVAAPTPRPAPAEGLMRMRQPGANLSLDWGTFQALEGNGPPVAPAGGPSARRRSREQDGGTTAERVARMLAPSGEDNIKAGRVHPQFYDYLRDVQARFHPTLATVERDAGTPKVAGFFKAWWQKYVQDLAAYSRQSANRPEPSEEQQGAVELSCDVCLTVRFGETPDIELVRGSISAEMNEEALAAVRLAVAARPATEPLVPAGATGTSARACYRFSASARRLPPTALGCSFDEMNLKVGCAWPLKKIFRSTVKLLTVGPG
jgi:hypothetical protein